MLCVSFSALTLTVGWSKKRTGRRKRPEVEPPDPGHQMEGTIAYNYTHTHTHTNTTVLQLYGFCLGQPGLAQQQKQESLANTKVNARQHCVSLSCLLCHVSQRVSLIVIPFCLSVWMSVIPRPTTYHDWSIRTKFGMQVHTWPCMRVSLFGFHCLPYFGCQREKYAKFCLFPTIKGCHLDIRAQIKKADVSRCICRWTVMCPNISKFDHEL